MGGATGCALAGPVDGTASASRARQLRWVVGELHRSAALDDGGPGECGPDCTALLAAPRLEAYLVRAAAGDLRERAPAGGSGASTPASMRVRRSCLAELCARARMPVVTAAGSPPPRAVRHEGDVRRFLSWLRRRTDDGGVRTAAVALLASCDLRVAEIAALRTAQVHDGGRRVVLRDVVRSAPGPGEPEVEDVALSGAAAAGLRVWLARRPGLVVSERVPTVLVTTHPTHRGGAVYAAGLPVSPRGLLRAHRRAVADYLTAVNPGAAERRAIADLCLGRNRV